ncbi:hypothetical protein GO986_08915 [Deinococcus sp. HMF7620]|uniref:Uncharacterized protein n=1 Tax=Deinococcus arboris TaxID=2682977 RepID=A0A7C9MR03_9DEIO|nr:hypothetical protein [Deinococcus arboris]MVN86884.1 hypothetical protein [Deinococcus arboris]
MTRLFVYHTGLLEHGEVQAFESLDDLLTLSVTLGHSLILDAVTDSAWLQQQHGPFDGRLEIYDGYRE